jgi:hypothetical protein
MLVRPKGLWCAHCAALLSNKRAMCGVAQVINTHNTRPLTPATAVAVVAVVGRCRDPPAGEQHLVVSTAHGALVHVSYLLQAAVQHKDMS